MFNFFQLVRVIGLSVSVAALPACVSASPDGKPPQESLVSLMSDMDDGHIFVVAHRGCWSAAPENSVAAMEACIRLGVKAVEIDVQMTGDGELIVFHDTTLKRMTPSWGYVSDKTLAELRELRLYERDGSPAQQFFRPLTTKEPIATLEEVFEVSHGKLMINLEVKSNAGANFQRTFDASVALAREMGVEEQVFWKIPSRQRGQSIADLPADLNYRDANAEDLSFVAPIIWQSSRPFTTQISDFNDTEVRVFEIIADDLDYWTTGADGRIIGSDQNRYMMIGVLPRWSAGLSDDRALASPDEIWGRMLELGADMIMTDRPEQLIEYLESVGKR